MKAEKKLMLLRVCLLFIIVESLLSIIYHNPNDPNLLSITNMGRYSRIIAALVALFLLKR